MEGWAGLSGISVGVNGPHHSNAHRRLSVAIGKRIRYKEGRGAA